jgi:hypothetical protein
MVEGKWSLRAQTKKLLKKYKTFSLISVCGGKERGYNDIVSGWGGRNLMDPMDIGLTGGNRPKLHKYLLVILFPAFCNTSKRLNMMRSTKKLNCTTMGCYQLEDK